MARDTTLLVDVIDRLGRLEGQNSLILQEQGRAAEGRKEIYVKLDDLKERMTKVETVAEEVKVMKPVVEELKTFRQKVAVSIVIVTGALWLIWQGIQALGPEIRNAATKILK